jgi:hypothetical protein
MIEMGLKKEIIVQVSVVEVATIPSPVEQDTMRGCNDAFLLIVISNRSLGHEGGLNRFFHPS